MMKRELERKEVLLDRELALLSEREDKFETETCERLRKLELRMKALELYVANVLPNTSGTPHNFYSQIL